MPPKVPLQRMTLTLPLELYTDVQQIVKSGRRWISEADFVRHAVANEVDRWKREHLGTVPPGRS